MQFVILFLSHVFIGQLIHQMLQLNMELFSSMRSLNIRQVLVNSHRTLIYIYRANVTANFVLSHRGKLVWSSSSCKLALRGLLMESVTMNTGVLLHFPELCLGCVFHKTSKSTTFFFMSLSESEELKIHKTSDVTSLIQSL